MRSLIALFLSLICCDGADAAMHGHARQVSSRAMINQNLYAQFDYSFINFLREGDAFLSPVGTNFATGTCYWATILDSNGWPNNACANGLSFGGGFRIPSSSQFSGQYTLDGSGLGVMVLGIGTQFHLSSGVQCGGVASGTAPNTSGAGWGYATASNGTITTNDTSGTGFCVPFTIVGLSAPELTNIHVNNTCSTTSGACTGAFIKNLRLYQQVDYARLAAGNVFRAEYLQTIATMDPSAIRFMAWGPGESYSGQIRWENRPSLTNTSGNSGSNWLSGSPPYTVSTGTNFVSVAAVAGTPAAMVHGEVATFRFGNSMNFGSVFGGVQISAVSNASPGVVTTASAHGYATGDVIIHTIQSPTNMREAESLSRVRHRHRLHSLFDAGFHGSDEHFAPRPMSIRQPGNIHRLWQQISLRNTCRLMSEIGRTRLLFFPDGVTPIIVFFVAAQGSYVLNATYDKNSCAITDGSGNNICGAWLVNATSGLCNSSGGVCGYESNTPVELEAEFINEVNALLVGGQNPVAMWVTLPHMSLVPGDPDYTMASDYPLNMAKAIISGTYPLCSGCPLIIEDSNEWWNFGYPTFGYYDRQNFLRYGISGSTDFGTLRAVQMFEDIHNNSGVYNPAVFHFALMGGPYGAVGDPTSSGSGNNIRLYGDTTIMTDVRWPNAASPPYAYFDYFRVCSLCQRAGSVLYGKFCYVGRELVLGGKRGLRFNASVCA